MLHHPYNLKRRIAINRGEVQRLFSALFPARLHKFIMPRNRVYFLVVFSLVLAFLAGPPIAFASRLPVACKPFHPEKAGKAGPCNFKILLSPDNPFVAGIACPKTVDDEIIPATALPEGLFLFFPLIIPDFIPLRC